MMTFDYLVVGAGFAGCILAERLGSDAGKRVLLVDKRNHIGGNAYDCYDDAGVLIHKYGPHIFHTNSKEVFDYLSRFTAWRPYQHRVMACVDGQLVPIPINLDTVNRLYGLHLTALELDAFFRDRAEQISPIRSSEDVIVSKVGRELYEKFFRSYTRKQWGLFFDFRYGKLEYRSLEFSFETHDKPVFQSAPVINYPNEYAYTRCTEFKYLTGQEHRKTTVIYEYPKSQGDPYYPVPRPENAELYRKYQMLASATTGVHFVGRLGTYKYYNMDQVVAQALKLYSKLMGSERQRAAG